MSGRDDARDAGLLLRYALGRANPARDDTYRRLLERYQADPALRETADQTAVGLGLRILATDRHAGLMLAAEQDSPLAVTDTSTWLSIRNADDRMIYGVALAGVAAYCYPNARSLKEPATRRVTAVDVDDLIRTHAAAVETGDVVLEDGLGDAWDAYAGRKQVEESATSGRLRRHCTVAMCEDALKLLSQFGLVVIDRTAPPPRDDLGAWRSTDLLRAHIAVSGGPLAWQTLAHSPIPDAAHATATTEAS